VFVTQHRGQALAQHACGDLGGPTLEARNTRCLTPMLRDGCLPWRRESGIDGRHMSALVRARRVAAPPWVLALLALLLVIGGAAPAHVHTDVSPGLYNAAHVLENLAARSADLSVPEASPAGVVEAPARTRLAAASPRPSIPVLRRAASRAPPTA
jgi:hypothetical protein